ncbi:hypothetical protein LEP1GSC062_0251 [Leptospira alexanderi serovar Manhao 3 str. L 60]|uniref:Uncharacterized protein n=4 Tax=Leptospira TaxID=171 RepID=V6I5A9_9LEPT|nr:hypothetical protein LEP1GSC062_0251 [Leptospira alexanderi serovar Manhao 3 str. L 60]
MLSQGRESGKISDKKISNQTRKSHGGAKMFYPEMDPNLKSSFLSIDETVANLVNNTILPQSGLKAGNLLNANQMKKLKEIRKRRFRSSEWKNFLKD